MDCDEARAFAAWCLSEVPRKARETTFQNNKPRIFVSFECLVKDQDALVSAFKKNCPAIQYTIWHSRQYPVYPCIDRVTVDFTWPKGTLRLDCFTTV